MSINLREFQLKAIADLIEAMQDNKKEIVLKSCTGSGKTIILTHFMGKYLKMFAKTVFIWLTPGKGDLEEQSKSKMDKYVHGSHTKTLTDILNAGFEENDICFINWENLNKKGNKALKDGERSNFLDRIEEAFNTGLLFKIIVDESHEGDTIKGKEIIEYFRTDKIIRASATPKNYTDAKWIIVPEAEVIAAGLIKKVLIINESIKQDDEVSDQIDYLLAKALEKQRKLYAEFNVLAIKKMETQSGVVSELDDSITRINPLIIVQLPNKNNVLLDGVEKWFADKEITYENGRLAAHLSERHENIVDIDEIDARPIAIIIKQAIATGWDCPRAQILVKLRDHMSETFEIQTIGRIRRMPEAKHYENPLLDSCYLYTLDERFTESVKLSLGKGALEASILNLRSELKNVRLVCEQVSGICFSRDQRQVLQSIYSYFVKHFNIDTRTVENKKRLEANEFRFLDYVRQNVTEESRITRAGDRGSYKDLNITYIHVPVNTHIHGREYHHVVSEIALRVGLDYSDLNPIFRRLFVKISGKSANSNQILLLETRDLYSFVLNNREKLKNIVRNAASEMLAQSQLTSSQKSIRTSEKVFLLPRECLFTYDITEKAQWLSTKNVYEGYLLSAAPRSSSEKKFEKYCETATSVEWVYKNGDKGSEFFSVVYEDTFGKARVFYPDYVISVKGEIWIIETKGGFDKYGNSEDIDKFSSLKFTELKDYLKRRKLNGGFVREDKRSNELCICTDNYSDDISSDNWVLLSNVIS